MKFLFLFLFFSAVVRTAGCDKSAASPASATALADCGPAIQVRNPLPRLTSDGFTVVYAEASGTCLSVTISATGCSSEGWRVNLWANEETPDAPSATPGGLLIFDDGVGADEMTCQAIVEETYEFDLSPYLTEDRLPASFTIMGTETTVTVEANR